MVEIGIEYRRFGFRRKVKGAIPERWDEVREKQLVTLANVTLNNGVPDYRYLAVMTGIKERLLKRLSAFETYNLAQELRVMERAGKWYDRFVITNYELRIANCGLVRYESPKPKLEGMTFGQFIFADAYYSDWVENQSHVALNDFISTVYQRPGEVFDHSKSKDWARNLTSVDINFRLAIALNWSLIMAWLALAYPLIFQEKAENPPSGDKPTDGGRRQSPWIKVFDGLVGDDLINRDRYAELPVHTVLRFMTEKSKERMRK